MAYLLLYLSQLILQSDIRYPALSLLAELDQCPNESGSLNGCPDSDSDGVSDINDQCPNEYGLQSDGCPVPVTLEPVDSDGDGINDDSDSCPSQAETINGYQDSDGCPDTVPVSNTSPIITGISSITTDMNQNVDIKITVIDLDDDVISFDVSGPPKKGIIQSHHF